MLNKSKKKGFTLVELIIVIMIVGISAIFISTSYVIAKRKAELTVKADEIVSSLKENRSKVKSGYRETEIELVEGEEVVNYGTPKCFGVRFDKEEGVFNIETPYANGECVKEAIEVKEGLTGDFGLEISEIKIATGTGFNQIDVLFEPPSGEIVLLSSNLQYEQRNLEIDFFAYNSEDEKNHRIVQVDTVSGKIGSALPQ